MAFATLTQLRLKELLDYDPETGVFTWIKPRTGVPLGAEAGSMTHDGYRRIVVDQQEYRAHRLAWLYVYGEMPSGVIDHINRVRDDNRISNLRDVTCRVNSHNHGGYDTNRSGVTGVWWVKSNKRYHAYLGRKYLGCYKKFDDAVFARRKAEANDPDHMSKP